MAGLQCKLAQPDKQSPLINHQIESGVCIQTPTAFFNENRRTGSSLRRTLRNEEDESRSLISAHGECQGCRAGEMKTLQIAVGARGHTPIIDGYMILYSS